MISFPEPPKSKFRYRFKSENRWHLGEAGERWELVRFQLEKKFHLHDLHKDNSEYAYLDGYWDMEESLGLRLQDNDYVRANALIILVRRPLPHGTLPFIPLFIEEPTLCFSNSNSTRLKRPTTHFSNIRERFLEQKGISNEGERPYLL